MTGNRGEAEDLAQEAFVKVYERWDRVRGTDNPAGYLYRTAINAHHSRLRRLAVAARKPFVAGTPTRSRRATTATRSAGRWRGCPTDSARRSCWWSGWA